MLSLQGYGIQHNTMSSFPSPSQSNLHCIKRTPDFTFCNVPKRKHQEKHEGDDGIHDADTVLPLPLWSKKIQSSCTCPSNAARLQAMVEGRKKLMELMEDLPESSYELSLKDIVVVEDQEGNLEIVTEERRSSNILKPKSKDKKEYCQQRKGPISRSISMDTGVFLLRMFTPSSFGLKKPNKVSRMSSMDSSIKRPMDREWLKTRFYIFSSNSHGSSNNSSCNSSSSSSSKTREAEGIFKRFSWFVNTTCKPRREWGCFFF